MGDFLQGILQSFVFQVVWELLLVLGGGAVIAYVRDHRPELASKLFYGLGTAAFIAILLFAITGRGIFSRPQPQIDASNAEGSIKEWIASLGLASVPFSLSDTYFAYQVTLPNGNQVA